MIAKNTVKEEEKKDIKIADTKTGDQRPDALIAKADTKGPDSKTTSTPINTQPNQTEKKDVAATNTNAVEKKPDASIAKIDNKVSENKTVSTPVNNQPTQNVKKDIAATEKKDIPVTNNNTVVKTETKPIDNKTIPINDQSNQNVKKDIPSTNTTAVKTDPKQTDSKLVSVPVSYQPTQNKNVAATNTNTVAKTETKPVDNKATTPATNQPNPNVKKDIAATEKKPDAGFEFQELKRDRKLKPAATLVDGRISIPSETIYFKSDSLSIALYDNGEVDGDSVSVIINDEMFIEKQLLKSSAFRKTFYVPQNESDSLLVVLYAENLGKYPPNTGLLQIKDGEEIFYVRFKADLDRNAAIVLRRKSK